MTYEGSRRSVRIVRALALTAALAAGVLTGCGGGSGSGEGDGDGDGGARREPRAEPSGRAIAFDLYTHCGIDEARIDGTFYEAVTPLSDGSGNPPEGWDNPTQRGTMTLTSETEAVFTDDAGHEVTFRVRPGATSFKNICG